MGAGGTSVARSRAMSPPPRPAFAFLNSPMTARSSVREARASGRWNAMPERVGRQEPPPVAVRWGRTAAFGPMLRSRGGSFTGYPVKLPAGAPPLAQHAVGDDLEHRAH